MPALLVQHLSLFRTGLVPGLLKVLKLKRIKDTPEEDPKNPEEELNKRLSTHKEEAPKKTFW